MSTKYNFDWEKLIKKQLESGLNAKNFCMQHSLPYQAFLAHRRSKEKEEVSLVPIKVLDDERSHSFDCNGKSFKLDSDIPIDFLAKLLKATEL